jgi:hypothetical protein
MVNDSGDDYYARKLDEEYPEFAITHHPANRGMAAAVQTGWKMALGVNSDYCFHLEEDFVITQDVNMNDLMNTLYFDPELASITLKRPPWAGIEVSLGDQLAAIQHEASWFDVRQAWDQNSVTRHNHLFSLNPSLIKREVIEMGWPSGPLGVGNEAGMTRKLLGAGYVFGVWGTVKDAPMCEHIGYTRGKDWQL